MIAGGIMGNLSRRSFGISTLLLTVSWCCDDMQTETSSTLQLAGVKLPPAVAFSKWFTLRTLATSHPQTNDQVT